MMVSWWEQLEPTEYGTQYADEQNLLSPNKFSKLNGTICFASASTMKLNKAEIDGNKNGSTEITMSW